MARLRLSCKLNIGQAERRCRPAQRAATRTTCSRAHSDAGLYLYCEYRFVALRVSAGTITFGVFPELTLRATMETRRM